MRKLLTLREKSFEANGVDSHKALWEKAKAAGYTGLRIKTHATIEAEEVEEGGVTLKKLHGIFSTDTEDRHAEIVYQDWDVKAFNQNPVLLDSHDYGTIESILGSVLNLKAKKNAPLEGDIVFSRANPRGVLAEGLVNEGHANAFSVGFIPKAFDEKGNITKSELLEISLVSVPANPEALITEKTVEVTPASTGSEDVDPVNVDPDTLDPQVVIPSESGIEIVVQDPADVPTGPVQLGASDVIGALRSAAAARKAVTREVASEVQKLVAPGPRKRALMQLLRSDLDT